MTEFPAVDLSTYPDPHDMSLTNDDALICRSVLADGVRMLTERVENAHTVFVGFWVGAESADENEETLGSTYLPEHLPFKGMASCSAKQLADRTDFLGGSFDTDTNKQLTYYYGHVVGEDLADTVELLADMIASLTLAEIDMEMERGVIPEKLTMYADDASEVAHEQIASLVVGGHPLGRPIGGTSESILGLNHTNLTSHYRQGYQPEGPMVTAAGKADHEALCAMIEASLCRAGWDLHERVAPAERRQHVPIEYPKNRDLSIERPVEQGAVVVGIPAMTDKGERRYALYTLSTVLGGDTSSRLFQKMCEKRGLIYSTYSFPDLHRKGGLFGLYTGCSPESTRDVTKIIEGCLRTIADESVTEMELETSYRRTRADHAFSSESVGSRMNQLDQAEVVCGSLISRQEALRHSRGVSADDVATIAAELAHVQRSHMTVGPSQ